MSWSTHTLFYNNFNTGKKLEWERGGGNKEENRRKKSGENLIRFFLSTFIFINKEFVVVCKSSLKKELWLWLISSILMQLLFFSLFQRSAALTTPSLTSCRRGAARTSTPSTSTSSQRSRSSPRCKQNARWRARLGAKTDQPYCWDSDTKSKSCC